MAIQAADLAVPETRDLIEAAGERVPTPAESQPERTAVIQYAGAVNWILQNAIHIEIGVSTIIGRGKVKCQAPSIKLTPDPSSRPLCLPRRKACRRL